MGRRGPPTATTSAFWATHDAELIRRWNNDEPASALAAAFGCSKEAVLGRLMRLRQKGVVLRGTVKRWERDNRNKWAQMKVTDFWASRQDEIVRLWQGGMTIRAIAAHLSVHVSGISLLLSKLRSGGMDLRLATTVKKPEPKVVKAKRGRKKKRKAKASKDETRKQAADGGSAVARKTDIRKQEPLVIITRAAAFDPIAEGDGVAFVDVKHGQCRWPIGGEAGPQMLMCGRPTKTPKHSWCRSHFALGYTTLKRRIDADGPSA